jgi:MipA family protein
MSGRTKKHPAYLYLPMAALAAAMSMASTQLTAGEWSVGGIVGVERNPLVGDDDHYAFLMPMVAYKGERFHANLGHPGINFFNGMSDVGGVGYSAIKQDQFNIDLVGKIRAIGIDPDEDDALSGLDERKPGIDFGVSARWTTPVGELNAQLLKDVSNRSKGEEAILAYAYPISMGQWTLRPEFGISWQSSDLNDYYVGVDSHEVTATRAAYEAGSTVTPFAGVQMEYAINQQMHLLGGIGVSRLGDEVSNSPIIKERNLAGGYVGLAYRF